MPPSGSQIAAEVVQLLFRQTSFQKGAGIDARRSMSLKEDQVAAARMIRPAKEVIESHFVQRRTGRVRRNVAANALVLAVRLDHHRHRVPANNALDAPLDLAIARKRRLLVRRNRVHIRRPAGHRQRHAPLLRVDLQFREDLAHPTVPSRGQQVFQGFEPIASFRRVHGVRFDADVLSHIRRLI